ncbi:hypothetical protein I4F81_005931 [Pyropia yezoensis]|uniref:Uncharacterized protein n=1 Tax=Pyropia yezoensis TaxID=2788 RepID=A0ACC3C0S9_PYRYE|nr:hypothetical protein I4F81_005931 [Neopyropia yezoensis]
MSKKNSLRRSRAYYSHLLAVDAAARGAKAARKGRAADRAARAAAMADLVALSSSLALTGPTAMAVDGAPPPSTPVRKGPRGGRVGKKKRPAVDARRTAKRMARAAKTSRMQA